MARYIDADALRKNEIVRCHCVPCIGSNDNNYKDLDEVLNDCPTADVVPRAEVAREIFEEIEKTTFSFGYGVRADRTVAHTRTVDDDLLAELKKKYTEDG